MCLTASRAVPIREDDATHPLGAYAVSKLAGELYARAYLDKALIIRTSGVYGPGGLDTARGNFVEMMLRLAAERIAHQGGGGSRGVADLRSRACRAHRGSRSNAASTGIFHIGGGAPISWFDWAVKIFEAAGLNPPLKPTNEREFRTAARRPKYSALSNAKSESLGIAPDASLDEAIRLYMEARGQEDRAGRGLMVSSQVSSQQGLIALSLHTIPISQVVATELSSPPPFH